MSQSPPDIDETDTYRGTIEATTYSGCTHCSRRDQLADRLAEFGITTDRLTQKRDRHERYKLQIPTEVPIESVREQVVEVILRGGPYQQVGTFAVGDGGGR